MTDLALIYLARGGPGALRTARRFAESYRSVEPGEPHQLVFAVKRWSAEGRASILSLADQICGSVLDLPDDGFDWGAYFRAAAQVEQQWICLLNSHSEPLVSGWLAKLAEAARATGTGMAGATGSWESLCPIYSDKDRVDVRLRKIAMTMRLQARFPKFPNPHLRSNALVLRRELLLDFARERGQPRKKVDAFTLESGFAGLSRFARQRGAELLVVGADGVSYKEPDWPEAASFRIPGQPNLMVADNRTREYDGADRRWRRALEFVSWGKNYTP